MAAKKKSSSRKPVRILSSKITYRGPVFHITSDQVKEPSGATVRRDVVRHSGSVVIMAVEHADNPPQTSSEPRVLLARQYRYAANQFMWELPAGRIDEGEGELEAAKRELLEETGYSARKWKRILHFYVSPGFMDETMAIFLAQDLTSGKAQPEEDESIAKRFFPLSQAVRMATKGQIKDAKTISGVLWLHVALCREK